MNEESIQMTSGKIIDPICEMIVDLAEARDAGLTLEYANREYAFCAAGCQTKFAKDPKRYIPKVEAWLANPAPDGGEQHAHAASNELPVIDAGMREWYKSCRCCLSDAYPKVVEALDGERAATSQAPASTGICEAAESNPA
jgi:YHS domain-containing protein